MLTRVPNVSHGGGVALGRRCRHPLQLICVAVHLPHRLERRQPSRRHLVQLRGKWKGWWEEAMGSGDE